MNLPVLARAHAYGVLVIGLFVIVLPSYARSLDQLLGGILPPWTAWAGWPIVLAGGLLSYWSFWTLVNIGNGTAFPYDPPRRFVEAGPYRSVRNPMYVGNLGMILGLALASRSPGMLAYAILMCMVTHLYVVGVEEPRLLVRHKDAYASYRRRVPRWMPVRAEPI